MRILLVEDDEPVALSLTRAFAAQHYEVNTICDGLTAWELVQASPYDLLVLDVGLPRLDGISLCRQVRASGYTMPILLLTAEDDVADRVAGLEAGADDYVSKPFDFAELLARIRALQRRSGATAETVLAWGDLHLNTDTGEVVYADTPLRLTPKEYGLLALFLAYPHRVFSRAALLDRIWAADEYPGEEAVTTQIKGLRHKLKEVGVQPDPIETLYGLGYRLKPPPKREPQAADTDAPRTERQAAEAIVRTAIARTWAQFQTEIPQRLQVFERVITQVAAGTLALDLQHQARAEAHKLIGSLGTFGNLAGAAIARQIEQGLQPEPLPPKMGKQLAAAVVALKQAIAQPLPHLATLAPPLRSATRLLIVDDDAALTQQLQAAASGWNVQIDSAPDLAAARSYLTTQRPDAVLLDLTFADATETGLTLLAELTQQQPDLPVLLLTAKNQLTDRVAALRLGSRGFLHKPVTPDQVFQAVRQALQQPLTNDAKVLLVDDDPIALTHVAELLQPWGFQVIPLDNPQQFWAVLEATQPDGIILDIALPGLSGIELCQVVRSDLRWSQIPILVLSAQPNADTIQQVFSAGADDYVAKPIVPAELIARLLARLERIQILRKLAKAQPEPSELKQ